MLLVAVVCFAELVETEIWAVQAEHHAHEISAQTIHEGIGCTKAKEQLRVTV